jgi:hypothetical protein
MARGALAWLLISTLLTACAPSGTRPGAPTGGAGDPPPARVGAGPTVGPQVGQRAPDFTVTTLDGKRLASPDLLAQNKPFILYFFASW